MTDESHTYMSITGIITRFDRTHVHRTHAYKLRAFRKPTRHRRNLMMPIIKKIEGIQGLTVSSLNFKPIRIHAKSQQNEEQIPRDMGTRNTPVNAKTSSLLTT